MFDVVVFVGITVVVWVSALYISNAYRDIHQESVRSQVPLHVGIRYGLVLDAK
jgi:hypothetical protein